MSYDEDIDAVDRIDVKRDGNGGYKQAGWLAKAGAALIGVGAFLGGAIPGYAQERPDIEENIEDASPEKIEKIQENTYAGDPMYFNAEKGDDDIVHSEEELYIAAESPGNYEQAEIYFLTEEDGEEVWKHLDMTFDAENIETGWFSLHTDLRKRGELKEVLVNDGEYWIRFHSDGQYFEPEVLPSEKTIETEDGRKTVDELVAFYDRRGQLYTVSPDWLK